MAAWCAARLRRLWRGVTQQECSGALGDVGTLVPLTLAMAKSGAVSFSSALLWAGAFNIATGWAWDVPMCVCCTRQPMNATTVV